ncbi:hypothetical protein D9M72_464390 [compost metagenome]
MAAQFAADLGQVVVQALFTQVACHRVDGKALGDGAEVQRHAAWLPGAPARRIDFDAGPAAAAARGLHRVWRRWRGARRGGAEAPQVHQRAGARIIGAAAVARHLQRALQHREAIIRQRVPVARRRAVEATQVRIRFPVAHPRDHAIEHGLDAGCDAVGIRRGRQQRRHRPGRAHGRAAPALQPHVGGGQLRRRGQRNGDQDAVQTRQPAYCGSTSTVTA